MKTDKEHKKQQQKLWKLMRGDRQKVLAVMTDGRREKNIKVKNI